MTGILKTNRDKVIATFKEATPSFTNEELFDLEQAFMAGVKVCICIASECALNQDRETWFSLFTELNEWERDLIVKMRDRPSTGDLH